LFTDFTIPKAQRDQDAAYRQRRPQPLRPDNTNRVPTKVQFGERLLPTPSIPQE
jgi:hypothetical protein